MEFEKRLCDMDELGPFIEESVKAGKKVKLTVTGDSMYPLFKSRVDTVVLDIPKNKKPGKYDIVFYKRDNGRYILHRILKEKNGAFVIAGDNEVKKEYPVRYMASSEQVTAPYVWFDMIDRTLLYNRIDVWTDTGKIKAVYFNEEYADRTYDLSDEARIKKANELVAKYAPQINLALYDVGHINSQNCVYYSLKVGYFGYQLAYEKHIKVFFKDDRVLCFDFGYDQDSLSGLLWDEVLVEEAVRQKATTLENENWKCTDIKLVEVDICKYGVPVVRSEVTFVFTQSGEKRVINFYTKISD